MKKLLAFGGSISRSSINKQFATWAVHSIPGAEPTILDLNDFRMPLYSIDEEQEQGIPQAAHTFLQSIRDHDGVVLSLAEHNGSYSVGFKNVFDWTSRIEQKVWSEKPLLLLSTSPGQGGGKRVLETAKNSFPHQGAHVAGFFSLPSFRDNFDPESGIRDQELLTGFLAARDDFSRALA